MRPQPSVGSQPNGPHYDPTAVAELDQFVNQVQSHGMHLLIDPLHVPGWANHNRGPNIAPTKVSRYYDLNKWLVNRYYPTVNGVEAWNEPNLPINFSSSMAKYVDVVRAGCRGAKAAHPDITYITGGVASNDIPWVHKFYVAGGGDVACWDYFGMHPYPKYHSPLLKSPSNVPDVQRHYFPKIVQVHHVMSNNNDHRKVFITEVGWSTHSNKGISNPFHWGVTQQNQSKYFQQAIHLVNSTMPWVAGFNLYTAANTPYSGNTTNNRYFGLMTLDLKPKLTCAALRNYLSKPTTP